MKKYHLHNRPNRELKRESEINSILKNGKFATVSLCRNNEPYLVTLNYGFDAEKKSLYFHCAPRGLKLEFLKTNENVCATVIEDGGYMMDECAHEYKSVVFWGKMQVVRTSEEQKFGMSCLLHHLEEKKSVIHEKMLKSDEYYSKMKILRLDITQIHGKAGR